jgi:hypothetical protein
MRESLGDAAEKLAAEQLDTLRQYAQAMANVRVEILLTSDSRS